MTSVDWDHGPTARDYRDDALSLSADCNVTGNGEPRGGLAKPTPAGTARVPAAERAYVERGLPSLTGSRSADEQACSRGGRRRHKREGLRARARGAAQDALGTEAHTEADDRRRPACRREPGLGFRRGQHWDPGAR